MHRLRRPSREQLCVHSRTLKSSATQLRSRCASKAFGWMPHCPPASAPVGKRRVPPGLAFLETVPSNGVGTTRSRW
jgi:hypothetical protein